MELVVPALTEYSVAQTVRLGGPIPRRPNSQLLSSQYDTEIRGRGWSTTKEGKEGSPRGERKQDASVWGRWFPRASDLPAGILTIQLSTTASGLYLLGPFHTGQTLQTIFGQCHVNTRDPKNYSQGSTEDYPLLQTHPWDAASWETVEPPHPGFSGKKVEQCLSCLPRVWASVSRKHHCV